LTPNSRLIQIRQDTQVVDFAYDALGRRTELRLPNGVVTKYRYDGASRLTELAYFNLAGPLGNLTYSYDPAGNRIRVGGAFARGLLPNPIASAEYDAANRQLAFGSTSMTSSDGMPAYDGNGNLLAYRDSRGATVFTWDAQNRLVAFNGPGVQAFFTYDPVGRRLTKSTNGSLVRYLYDGEDVVQQVTDGVRVTYLRSTRVDEPLVRDSTEYYLAGALGSIVGVTDSNGSVQTEYTYDPFGGTEVSGGSLNPFQYTGRENDGLAAGLYFYRARYYATELDRFISEDPIRQHGVNDSLYAYVDNRPTVLTDPSGEAPPLLLGIIAVGAVLGASDQVLSALLDASRALAQGDNVTFSSLGQNIGEAAWRGARAGAFAAAVGILTAPSANPALIGSMSNVAYQNYTRVDQGQIPNWGMVGIDAVLGAGSGSIANGLFFKIPGRNPANLTTRWVKSINRLWETAIGGAIDSTVDLTIAGPIGRAIAAGHCPPPIVCSSGGSVAGRK